MSQKNSQILCTKLVHLTSEILRTKFVHLTSEILCTKFVRFGSEILLYTKFVHLTSWTSYVFCMYISRLFSYRIKLRLRNFRNLIELALQDFLKVVLILFYLKSIWAWVKTSIQKSVLKILWLKCLVRFTRTIRTRRGNLNWRRPF